MLMKVLSVLALTFALATSAVAAPSQARRLPHLYPAWHLGLSLAICLGVQSVVLDGFHPSSRCVCVATVSRVFSRN